MRVRSLTPALTVVLLLSVGALGPACGGDGENGGTGDAGAEPALAEYFRQIDQTWGDSKGRADTVEERLDAESEAVESAEEVIDLFKEAIGDLLDIAAALRDDLSAVQAPPEVSAFHGELVGAWDDNSSALEDLLGDVEGVASDEEVLDLLSQIEEEFGSLGERTERVCLDLQDIADENNIDVDLQCGQDEEE